MKPSIFSRTLFIFVCLFYTAATAQIATRFQPATVALGQSSQLIFTANKPFSAQPDLSVLTDDFEIAGSQTRSLTNIVNGTQTNRYELIYNLLPLKTGTFHLSPQKIGNETTTAAHLTVETSVTPTADTPDIQLRATLSDNTIYIGESLNYIVTLTERTPFLTADISAPGMSNATIEQFSDDSVLLDTSVSPPANVLTRTYLITPHTTGEQIIRPARFRAQIPQENPDNAVQSPFGRPIPLLFGSMPTLTKDILLTAQPLSLTVLPKPADYGNDWWLPAQALNYSLLTPVPEQVSVGDPITLVLEITAVGTDAEQLPTLDFSDSPHFKIYTNPPQRQNFIDMQGRFTGRLAQEVHLIPLHAGSYALPLPHLIWFNTTARQKQTATLPEHIVRVEQGILPPTSPLPPTPSITPDIPQQPVAPITDKTPLVSPDLIHAILKWGSTTAFFLLAFGGVFFIIRLIYKKRRTRKRLPDLYPY